VANRWPPIVLLATALCGGCAAVPVGVKVASLVGDGISYAATGKSLTDHLISGAMHRDCALLRVVQGDSICRRDDSESPDKEAHPAPVVEGAALASAAPAPAPIPAAVDYLVVGSFADPLHAKRWQMRYQAFHAMLARDRTAAASRIRVVIGPLTADGLNVARRRLKAFGADKPWRLTLCPTTLTAPPCSASAATVAQN
jgi:hypothetical protein